MARVLLHIGTHKTATTTLQDVFHHNSDLLARAGIIYPRLHRRITGHHGLVHDWGAVPDVYRLPGGSRAALTKLARDYADTDHVVIVSSEEFSRADPNTAPDLAEIAKILSPFDRVEVLCTLRGQWEFLQSVYQELSKKRSPPRPPQLVGPVIKSGCFAGLFADYTLLLDRLETCFPADAITLIDYHSARAGPGGIVGAVLAMTCGGRPGHPLPDPARQILNQLNWINDGASNVSPPPLATWAANILAEPQAAPPWLLDLTSQICGEKFGAGHRGSIFTRDEFQTLSEHFGNLNRILARRRHILQPEFQITPPRPDHITHFRNHMDGDMWMRLAREMAARGIGAHQTAQAAE